LRNLAALQAAADLAHAAAEPATKQRSQGHAFGIPNAQVHLLDAGHFALDTAADEIAALLRGFVET
jgi:hypothetical protein